MDEFFGRLDNLGVKLTRAASTCQRIAMNEQAMGYQDSADTYNALAEEITVARKWVIDTEIQSFAGLGVD